MSNNHSEPDLIMSGMVRCLLGALPMRRPILAAYPLVAAVGLAGATDPAIAKPHARAASAAESRFPSTGIVDRSRPDWWRSQPEFVDYQGRRPGYAYAPGYGYYPTPDRPFGGAWVVGSHYPVSMRRFIVATPARYGLPAPSPGHGWYYADDNFVLVRRSTWVVTRTVAGGW